MTTVSGNEAKADSIVRRAENTRDGQEALWLYNQAAQLLAPLQPCKHPIIKKFFPRYVKSSSYFIWLLSSFLSDETDNIVKDRLRGKLNLCLRRVEELSSLHAGASNSAVPAVHRKRELAASDNLAGPSPFEELCKFPFEK